jgi:hypothetical protein
MERCIPAQFAVSTATEHDTFPEKEFPVSPDEVIPDYPVHRE